MTWECLACNAITYAPAISDTCRILNGPAER
jgi:hypothetical protein